MVDNETHPPVAPKRSILVWVLLAIAVAIIVAQAASIRSLQISLESPKPASAAMASYLQIGKGTQVLGHLARPLGTRVKLTGHVKDPPPMFGLGDVPFEVTGMDGQHCEPVVLWLQRAAITDMRPTPGLDMKKGVEYEVVGCETGEFFFPPGWARSGLQKVFSFHLYFLTTSVVEVAANPAGEATP